MTEQAGVPGAAGQGASQAAPATELSNPAAAQAAPAAVEAAGGADPAAADPYYAGYELSPEERGWVELKGWKTYKDQLTSHRNLEKMRGVPPERLLTLPESMDDKAALAPIYAKLGMAPPEKPEDYGLATMEGADLHFAKAAEQGMHKIGVPAQFAKPMAQWLNEYNAQQVEAANQEIAAEMGALKAKWGGQYDANLEAARRAMAEYEGVLDKETRLDIEASIGSSKMLELFLAIGQKQGEAAFVEGKPRTEGFTMSPEAAKARLAELMTNTDWFKRWRSGDKGALGEFSRLNAIAYQGGGDEPKRVAARGPV